jgi:hypothetical protein
MIPFQILSWTYLQNYYLGVIQINILRSELVVLQKFGVLKTHSFNSGTHPFERNIGRCPSATYFAAS